MADFVPKKINLSQINGGQRYELGDVLSSPDTINAPIEAAALLQNLATNAPDYSEANKVGTPTVEIGGTESNPKFVFKNLKGDKGDKGNTGARGASGTSAVLENENHDSDIDGYTQNFVNRNFSNPNLLINGDFSINQRGQTSYSGNNTYCVDRWRLQDVGLTFDVSQKTLSNSDATTARYMLQKFDEIDTKKLQGKTVTISANISNKLYSATINIPQNPEIGKTIEPALPIPNGVLYLYCYSTGLIGFVIGVSKLSSITLDYVKLEFGSVATPNFPRAYAEELALCHRYYRRYTPLANTNGTIIGTFFAGTTSAGFMLIDYGTPMRKTPTLIYDISKILVSLGTSSSYSNFNTIGFADIADYQKEMLYCTGTFEAGKVYMVRIAGGSYFEADAEIY